MLQSRSVRRGAVLDWLRSLQRRFAGSLSLMRVAIARSIVVMVICGTFLGPQVNAALAAGFDDVPVKDMVTMIDLGATSCIPCKMMAPIIEKLEKDYRGKAAIVFIDVWKNKEQAGRFGIRAIPTQVFYDEGGKEVYRHVGFMAEKDIVAQLKKMGIE